MGHAADPEVFPWTALGTAPAALLLLANHEDRLESRLRFEVFFLPNGMYPGFLHLRHVQAGPALQGPCSPWAAGLGRGTVQTQVIHPD